MNYIINITYNKPTLNEWMLMHSWINWDRLINWWFSRKGSINPINLPLNSDTSHKQIKRTKKCIN